MFTIILVLFCSVSVIGIVLKLEALHWSSWLAITVGIPLGFVVGFLLFFILGFLLNKMLRLLSRGKFGLPHPSEGSLLENVIMPTLWIVLLTLILVPVFNKVKHNAELHSQRGSLQQPVGNVP